MPVRIPAGFLHGLDQGAGPGFDGVNLRPVSGVSRQAESTAQSRHSTGLPTPHLDSTQDGQHQVDAGLADRRPT